MTYPILVDLWEGSLDIDEPVLLPFVSGLIPRLNHISGQLHKDELFDQQWAQAEPFSVRFPYFVYTPWSTGRQNFDWLMANLPAGVRRVAVDVEVKRDGYSPTEYAANVDGFYNLCCQAGLWPVIYTGAWFLTYLSKWPTKAEYWWARYPTYLYPAQSETVTWEYITNRIAALIWSPTAIGQCQLWQCSADRYKLPGCCGRVVDLNVWRYSEAELVDWVGAAAPRRSWQVEIDAWARKLGYSGVGPEGAG